MHRLDITAQLRVIKANVDSLVSALDDTPTLPAYMTDTLEPDGAWRPAWLVELNEAAKAYDPDGIQWHGRDFEDTIVTLVHSILWWPIDAERKDLTDGQRYVYDHAQGNHYAEWMLFAVSRWPIMPLPRDGEDRRKPGAEIRYAVLAAPPGFPGALPTEAELRACIESHYRASKFLPPLDEDVDK